ncbi:MULTISPECIES: MerR family transcriptional regulator [Streptomyces]|uniref:MerR family transcriptional regulator n=1 Tax=Streptomyces koelreuteriae TaxID=2838015 RepID=A0ABX8FPA1_9ACTN|nr:MULTISPECIES: MerR family transcriptional regulator [Streptomyces]QWB22969.1 MerR family transcriptional regulator [Streptomyces koelreuteriae]UUA05917.1 MerR family transcriptional regulator [Streptomyces koelreuteriae]UUA13545.1 MerR family transcriptional regulator [Streptomyces sp. CRCS-T-1]
MTDEATGLLTIGDLARVTGLTVRTIRYWSDEGALPPVARSAGGYRLYDAASVARLELIRTLRELGLGLADVRRVLAGETTVARVAAAHVVALDAQISSLKVTRAVLSTVAKRGSSAEEMTLMNRLARLSAAERRQIVEDFMAEVFEGIDTADPDIRRRLRLAAAELPDDPTPEQVDAWVELAELIQDPGFRAQMRQMVEFNAADRGPDVPAGSSLWFVSRLVQLAADARRRGIAPGAPEADAVLRDLLGDTDRSAVLDRLTAASNVRVARYRELQAVVGGLDPQPTHDEEFAWVVAALEARTAS